MRIASARAAGDLPSPAGSVSLTPLSSIRTIRPPVKVPPLTAPSASASSLAATDEGDEDAGGPASDPVRIYLRQMSSSSLLTREQETLLAGRIKTGEQRVLKAVLSNPLAWRE